ncbi:MAG: hypothetical protein KC800_06610 [Candidatus Eremiobacteraeota bacterium]|nr:hypothetical protein [Candidatus Eremiobacteraeota bacterium]
MSLDWDQIATRLKIFWAALPPSTRLLSEWTESRRFPELTYIREELIGSYKARKYLSLIPWLMSENLRRVRVHGSSHSTNVTQLGLLLRSHGIEPVYQMEGRGGPPAGNELLARLVYGPSFKSPVGETDFSIPEGGSCAPALAGSLGLAGSMVERALERRAWKTDIYIDSGTGFSAAALLLGLGFFQLPCRVVVVSMTGQSKGELEKILDSLSSEYERLLNSEPTPPEFEVHLPPVGPSFGSVPTASLAEVAEFAEREGLLVDPIYAAKLGLFYREVRSLERPAYLFVSGGARELLCFQGPLRKWLAARDQDVHS